MSDNDAQSLSLTWAFYPHPQNPVSELEHTQSCVQHHVIYYFTWCQELVQTCSNYSIVWITSVCHIMLYNEATMSQWTVSLVTPPQMKCFFQWTRWVGISVRGSELVNLRFTLTSERLMGRDPGKITLQIQLEFFKSLADTRTAGLARISQGKGPTSKTAGVVQADKSSTHQNPWNNLKPCSFDISAQVQHGEPRVTDLLTGAFSERRVRQEPGH